MKLPCIRSSNFKLLSPALASLKSLQVLLLDTDVGPDCKPMLQQTLEALPTLQRLSISFFISETLKRPRAEEGPARPQHCMSAMLSDATALTSLDIFTVTDLEYLTATSAVSLPHLRHLAVHLPCKHTTAAASLLSHLSAPLTSLDMHHDKSLPLPPTAAPDVQPLLTILAKFTELHSLALAIPHDDDPANNSILAAVSAAAPTTLAALPRLASLSISSELPVLQLVVPLLATSSGQAGLTELVLSVSSRASAAGWEAWPQFLQQLSLLKLQRLKVTVMDPAAAELPGLVALPPLPHLTALSLDDWACLKCEEDLTALASMTQLEKLHLVGMRLPELLREECARCLGALSALTSLLFRSATEEGSISDVLDSNVPKLALDLLEELGLDAWWASDSMEAVMERNARAYYRTREPFPYVYEVEKIVSSAGNFALRLPALTRLDIFFEEQGNAQAGVHKLECCLEAISAESAMLMEVTTEGRLPF